MEEERFVEMFLLDWLNCLKIAAVVMGPCFHLYGKYNVLSVFIIIVIIIFMYILYWHIIGNKTATILQITI